jgi:eukaryotic-like serine/threonine-protein kinase
MQSEVDGKLMAWVPAGRFRMGYTEGDDRAHSDESPAHYVTVGGFWMDVTEVTNEEYRVCVRAGGCTPPRKTSAFEDPDSSDHPVRFVSWDQAKAYAAWAGKRLPCEAEFEYAARAGVDTSPFPWGWSMSRRFANSMGPLPSTKAVGSYPANQWGLYDVIGNVAEWCEDRYQASYENAPSTAIPWTSMGDTRVVRGGSFRDPGAQLRTSRRDSRSPDKDSGAIGFRCVLDED